MLGDKVTYLYKILRLYCENELEVEFLYFYV
jgi:hypothetical protein